jgi:predicted transposase/invertase (TIGR01784 family)
MNHMEKLSNIPWAAQDELYEELSKVSNVAALSQKELEIYEENLRQYRDNLATLEASYLDGKNESKLEIARNLMALNVSDEIIMRSTGLSLDEVQKMRGEL